MLRQILTRKHKLLLSILFLLFLLAIPEVRHALADYLGPDRVITTYETETYDVGVWADKTDLSCNPIYGEACIQCAWEKDPFKASCAGPVTSTYYWYKTGTETVTVSKTATLPEATITGALQNCNLQNGWCTAATILQLVGTEPLAGESILFVEGTQNGAVFTCSGVSCDIPLAEGENTFTYWALSSYGDSSRMGTLTAKVDAASPTINGSIAGTSGANGWFISDVTLSASASDPTPGSGLLSFETSLDEVNWTPYTAPQTFSEGSRTLYLRAIDAAGNLESFSQALNVDSALPLLDRTITGTSGANGWYISSVTVDATASDPAPSSGLSAFETTLDGSNWTPYSAPLTFNDGSYSLQIHAIDTAGNQVSSTDTIQVDTVHPSVSGSLSGTLGSGGWYTSAVQASASATDATSGIASIEYAADGGTWTTYPGSLGFYDGTHSLQFRTTDIAGLGDTSAVFDFKVDTGSPHISIPDWWYIWESADFRVTDNNSTIASVSMSISGPQGRWQKVEQNWTPSGTSFTKTISWDRRFADGTLAPIGSYRVTIYAQDQAGNESQKTATIIIPAADATAIPRDDDDLALEDPPMPTATPTMIVAPPVGPQPQTEAEMNPQPSPTPTNTPVPVAFSFGSDPEPEPLAAAPVSGSNILWGAAAAAALGIYSATAEARRKEREEAEARSYAAAKKKAAQLNEAERQRKISNYLKGKAAREEAERVAAQQELHEKQLGFKENFLNPVVVDEPSLAEVQKRMALEAMKDAELDSATQSYMAMGAAVQKKTGDICDPSSPYYDYTKCMIQTQHWRDKNSLEAIEHGLQPWSPIEPIGICPVDAEASGFWDLINLGINHAGHANIVGKGLQSLKNDPSVQDAQGNVINQIACLPEYGNEAFVPPDYIYNDDFTANGPTRNWLLGAVGMNKAFWMVHSASVYATNTKVDADGTISTKMMIYDEFDFLEDPNKDDGYNFFARRVDPFYYGLHQAKESYPVHAYWDEIIQPVKCDPTKLDKD